MTPHPSPSPGWHLQRQGDVATLRLTGDWIAAQTGLRNRAEVEGILADVTSPRLLIDAQAIGTWDSALVAFMQMVHLAAAARMPPLAIDETGLPKPLSRLLRLLGTQEASAKTNTAAKPSLPRRIGEWALGSWGETVALSALVGETALQALGLFGHRTRMRAVDVFQLVREAGAGALMIVAIVNGLVGAILAFVGVVQLQRFGASIYVVNLVGVAVAREMAAIVTAIVMAGRTGGAYAAHLATMQGNEEIDALRVLGIPVFDFLILPRILALTSMMPLLYLYGCAFGFLGGFVVSLGAPDLTAASFLHQLRGAVSGTQFEFGLAKSVVFGVFIALTSCRIGLRAGRSAADVGQAATAAVVVGIVGIIAVDAIFAVCANSLGI